MPLAFFIGPTEGMLIAGMVLFLWLAPKMLPKSMRGVGESLGEARRVARQIEKGARR